jgi:catechol-2,3-dioxygenase
MTVRRLNHAVLYVRDAQVSARFYREVLGFVEVASMAGGAAVFLRAGGSDNHHDLGLFTVGSQPAARPGTVGLYHLAWQVDTIDQLVALRERLRSAGAFVGESDHGASKSVYARDPDGIEFEVMWAVPVDAWADAGAVDGAPIRPLDLPAEVARWSGVATG